jgi:hypothetical protein
MDNSMVAAAMNYAARGWKVVPVHGIGPNGKCSCGNEECPSPGKHPRLRNWAGAAIAATEDDIAGWGDAFKGPSNIGILLGPASGVIDIETDSIEGAEALRKLIGEEGITPTWGSSRGQHRLFKWGPHLPDVQKVCIGGIEMRIGGGGAQTQSIAPMSRHHSGAQYLWIPGLSPDEVEVADVPQSLLDMMFEVAGANGAKTPARVILDKGAVKGDRHNALLRFAVRVAMGIRQPTQTAQQDVLWIVESVNEKKCSPPLPKHEVDAIVRYAIDARLKSVSDVMVGLEAAEVAPPGDSAGLTLTIVKSDPPEYILHCPEWGKLNGTGDVFLTEEEFGDAEAVPRSIHRQIPEIWLERTPGEFSNLWAGRAASKKNPHPVEGLASVLVREAVAAGRVKTGAAVSHETREMLRSLIESLESAAPAGMEDTPDSGGAPTRMADGTVWFVWSVVVREILSSGRLPEAGARRIRRAVDGIIEGGLECSQHMHNGVRRLYTKATREDIAKLRAAAYVGVADGGEIRPAVLPKPVAVVLDKDGEEDLGRGLFDGVPVDGEWQDPFEG